MKTSIKVETYCGLSCTGCEFKEQFKCSSCTQMKGCPSWVTGESKCEIAECVKAKQAAGYGLEFCGECPDFPCSILQKYSNDPEHGDNPKGARIEHCKELKKARVDEAKANRKNVMAPCGFHCDYCFFGEWCGGCRSDYNCCSFATMFPDKKCPNVTCSESKKLEYCYECPELEQCKKGFFDGDHGVTAKAHSIFIKKHGLEAFMSAVKKSIDAGLVYIADSDKDKDGKERTIEEAIALLEKYL